METFSALLAICAGNSPVTGEFPTQRPVRRSFGVFFDLCLNKLLSKQWWGWLFETPSHPLWRHCNVMLHYFCPQTLLFKCLRVKCARSLSTGRLGTHFSEIWIKRQDISFKKKRLKRSSVKWRPFCSGGNELTNHNPWPLIAYSTDHTDTSSRHDTFSAWNIWHLCYKINLQNDLNQWFAREFECLCT